MTTSIHQYQNIGLHIYICGIEDIWEKEIKKCPKFVEVILQGGASQKEAVGGTKLPYNLRELKAEST